MGSEYIEQMDRGPMCPQSHNLPIENPLHALAVQIGNKVYEAADKDSDNEIVPEHDKLVNAAIDYDSSYMRLYRASSMVRPGGRGWQYTKAHPLAYIVAWYFQCEICGFVLPAVMEGR